MVADKAEIWKTLSEIPDPDIPVVSITDLGLVSDVHFENEKLIITLRPSYSGCPAMDTFRKDILTALNNQGIHDIEFKISYSPAWTTDLIGPEAREKMRKHGIAPPEDTEDSTEFFNKNMKPVTCPWCNSNHTKKTSQFGSTPCKALWFCNDCHQPFEYFKCFR